MTTDTSLTFEMKLLATVGLASALAGALGYLIGLALHIITSMECVT